MFLVLGVSVVLAVGARGDIYLSHHDFSRRDWSKREMCLPCHTPHHADPSVDAAPLWNHLVTSSAFSPYASPTMDAAPGQPGGLSKLCLSCHDGTVAIDSFGGTAGSIFIQPPYRTGTNLAFHHPISFSYDSALAAADGELHDPGATPSGLGGTIAQDLLFDGKLECSSCHDVHVQRNTQGCTGCHNVHGADPPTLSLRKDNAGSDLCLTCHRK